ncbi:hypothetical protein, partial [Ralstonia solanacearum]|uniref:hypothetical protein n=1 Tax=Ralstonia solanacearum TaxID=305 RepID=UPI001E5A2EC7
PPQPLQDVRQADFEGVDVPSCDTHGEIGSGKKDNGDASAAPSGSSAIVPPSGWQSARGGRHAVD